MRSYRYGSTFPFSPQNHAVRSAVLAAAMLALHFSFAQPQARAADQEQTTRYTNGHWYRDDGFVTGDMCVADGLFVELSACSASAKTVDLKGTYVVPPYADAHTHNFMLAPPESHASILDGLLAQGIFYTMEQDSFDALPDATREMIAREQTPDIISTHTIVSASGAAPIMFKDQYAAQRSGTESDTGLPAEGNLYYRIDSRADLGRVGPALAHRDDLDFVKVILAFSEAHSKRAGNELYDGQVGLNPTLLAPLVNYAHAADKRVSVHIENAADFHAVVAAGADFVAHLPASWKLAPGPGFFGTGYYDIDPRHWLITPADAHAAAAKHICVISTTMKDKTAIDYMRQSDLARQNLELLRKEGACILIGTDGGDIVDETMQVAEFGDFDNATALDILTDATPRAIYPGRAIGRLEAGYEASFVAVAGNPLDDLSALKDIQGIVKQGHAIRLPAAKTEQQSETPSSEDDALNYQAASVAAGVWSLTVPGVPFADTIGVIDVGDGFVMIDDGFPDGEESVRAALRGLGGKPVSYVINTHYHHVGANAEFGDGATIIAHKSVRNRMSQKVLMYGRIPQGPFPENAMPDVEVDESKNLKLGDWTFDIRHLPNAHTDGDLVIFVSHPDLPNPVVFTGDVVVNGMATPDIPNGGTKAGEVAALDWLRKHVPDYAILVTGHGGLLRGMDIDDQYYAYKDLYDHIDRQVTMGAGVDDLRAMPFPKTAQRWLGQPGGLPKDFIVETLMAGN